MLESLYIENFKGFSSIHFPEFARLNIFIGNNDAGKTSALEALMAFSCGTNISPLQYFLFGHRVDVDGQIDLLNRFGAMRAESIMNCFYKFRQNRKLSCRMEGCLAEQGNKSVSYEFQPSLYVSENLSFPPVESQYPIPDWAGISPQAMEHAVYLGKLNIKVLDAQQKTESQISHDLFSPITYEKTPMGMPIRRSAFLDIHHHRWQQGEKQIFAKLSREGALAEMCDSLNQAFPELHIQNIENVPYPDASSAALSFRIKGEGLRPIYAYGDGVRRWYAVLGNIVMQQHGILCIEEVDGTFHPASQFRLVVNLRKAAERYDTQIFMTTHNLEFLHAVLESIGAENTDYLQEQVRVITLRRAEEKSEILQRTLDGRRALNALHHGWELRK